MSTHANRVKMTVTSVASSGTGDITLNAASTGFRSFATAYGANATVDILITEGTAWEIARNCTYTHSGTTVSRGTLENSSTGSAVAFTSDAVVSVIATAAFGNNAALNHVAASPTTAGVTGVVGTMHLLDISGLTASRNFTLPATAAVGDRVGVYITTGDDTYALIIIGDTGVTINGGSAATEWSRLFVANEFVILRCVTANTAWVVESQTLNNIYTYVRNNGSTTQTFSGSAATDQVTTALTTVVNDPSLAWDTTNKRFNPKRRGLYQVSAGVQFDTSTAAQLVQGLLYLNGASEIPGALASSLNYALVTAAGPIYLNGSTDYVDIRVYHGSSATTLASAASVYFKAFFVGL
jgi:hypothetical protein